MADTLTGIVLYTRQYKDNDLLVHMLTQEVGLQTFLARGAKKPKSKLTVGTQPFTLVTFLGALPKRGGGLGYLNDVQAAQHFPELTENLTANAYATLIGSLLDAAFDEGVALPKWFTQLTIVLNKFQAGLDPQILANIFEIQLLPEFGVPVNWRADPIDGQMDGEFDYSEKFNGVLGAQHYDLDEHRLQVTPKAMYYLRLFSAVDLTKVNTINIAPSVKREIQRVIDHIYERQIGLKPRAKQFIEQMQAWDNQIANIPKRAPKGDEA
ncbi:MAG TPA: DNA repair protein RecO [Lactobacillaceae bacterium]|jgi:DNA repair protein RecO